MTPGLGPRLSPQLRPPPVAPAAQTIRVVAHVVLPVEVLVIVLSRIEGAGRHDLGDDGLREPAGSLDPRLRVHGESPLALVVVEDRRAILPADVAELAVPLPGIHVVPEHV